MRLRKNSEGMGAWNKRVFNGEWQDETIVIAVNKSSIDIKKLYNREGDSWYKISLYDKKELNFLIKSLQEIKKDHVL